MIKLVLKIVGLGSFWVVVVKCSFVGIIDIGFLVGFFEVIIFVDDMVYGGFVVFDLFIEVEYGLDFFVYFVMYSCWVVEEVFVVLFEYWVCMIE